MINRHFLQILAELERVMGKPIKNTWDKIVPKILMASKFDATPYFSALCDGECLEGEFHTSNRILMGTFPYMHVFFGLLEAYHCKNKLTTSIEMCNFPLHV